MSDDQFARRLPDLMHDLAGSDERYIDDILARTARTGQRAAWTHPTRWLPAPTVLDRLPAYQSRLVVVLLLVAMLALLVATAAFVGSAQGPDLPTSRSNGLIAISANPRTVGAGEAGDIYILQEGSPARRIIGSEDDGIAQACPRFSPDGRLLAYGESTADPRTAARPYVWPVEDRAVVVVEVDQNGDPSSTLLRVPLPTDPGEMACPEWSPSGEQLAFRDGTELWVVDAASGLVRKLPVKRATGEQGFEWSRDGSRIAVAEIGQIRVVEVEGGGSIAITVGSTSPRSLSWVAGNRVIYTTPPGAGVRTINVIDVDGSNETQVVRGDARVSLIDPTVSPDGTRIAFIQSTTVCTRTAPLEGSCSQQPPRVLVVEPDGSPVVEVPVAPGVPVSGPQWSPDGQRLLFVSLDVVSVPLTPGGAVIVYSRDELNLEWSTSEVSWQAVSP